MKLSLREKEMITLVADGMSNKEIAEKMRYTYGTIKGYLSGIYDKLGIDDKGNRRARLTRMALQGQIPEGTFTEFDLRRKS